MDERGWESAKKLLGWLCVAKRRLTWKEIQVALSIDVENECIDHINRSLRDQMYQRCNSLVLVTGDRVSLVHSTAKTYVGIAATTLDTSLTMPDISRKLPRIYTNLLSNVN